MRDARFPWTKPARQTAAYGGVSCPFHWRERQRLAGFRLKPPSASFDLPSFRGITRIPAGSGFRGLRPRRHRLELIEACRLFTVDRRSKVRAEKLMPTFSALPAVLAMQRIAASVIARLNCLGMCSMRISGHVVALASCRSPG